MDVIDMFAGLGGFSEGAEQAGCRVVWAANHWRLAVDTHDAAGAAARDGHVAALAVASVMPETPDENARQRGGA